MERAGQKVTCLGCRHKREKLIKCARIGAEYYCAVGNRFDVARAECDDFKPRFEKKKGWPSVKIEVELL